MVNRDSEHEWWNGCGRKLSYASVDAAKQAIADKGKRRRFYYRCLWCRRYHVASGKFMGY